MQTPSIFIPLSAFAGIIVGIAWPAVVASAIGRGPRRLIGQVSRAPRICALQ